MGSKLEHARECCSAVVVRKGMCLSAQGQFVRVVLYWRCGNGHNFSPRADDEVYIRVVLETFCSFEVGKWQASRKVQLGWNCGRHKDDLFGSSILFQLNCFDGIWRRGFSGKLLISYEIFNSKKMKKSLNRWCLW